MSSQLLSRQQHALLLVLIAAQTCSIFSAELSSMGDLCKGLGRQTFPADSCYKFIQCTGGAAKVQTCPAGQNYSPKLRKCDKTACSSNRGFWRQIMPTGGLVGIHCTLMPYSNLVVIWHRGIAYWNGVKVATKLYTKGFPKNEMLSAVLDPVNNRFQGYEVAPPFCSGHTQLPDGSILNCGGEFKGMNRRRGIDKDDAIYNCRIFKCKGNSVSGCSWAKLSRKGMEKQDRMESSRWYPGQIMFPAYDSKGPFALLMGGSIIASDPTEWGDVPQRMDWVWPMNRQGKMYTSTPETSFTKTLGNMNMYPVVLLMPYRANGKYVMFQWAINYGELVTVDNPSTSPNPISVLKVIDPIQPDIAITYPAGGCAALHALEAPYEKSAKVTMFGGHWGKYSKFADLRDRINADTLAADLAFTIDLADSDPKWEKIKMPNNAVLRTCITLPTGKILLFHGVRKGRSTSTTEGKGCTKEQVYNTWIFDPKTQTFTVDPTLEPTYRAYHGCGLLMPDGSLFAGGGDTDPVKSGSACTGPLKLHTNIDGYIPPSNFKAIVANMRPAIKTYPRTLLYGSTVTITYTGTVDECSLVTPGANTHAVEQSSRVVILSTVSNNVLSRTMQVQLPSKPEVMMPGPQMLFCMANRDVYSKGVWITLKY